MYRLPITSLSLCLMLTASACGDDGAAQDESNNTSNNTNNTSQDRGGPDNLVGVSWRGQPQTINGVTLEPTFRFERDKVRLTNTCNGQVTASVEAPVRYHYTAVVPTRAEDVQEDGGATCSVSVEASTFNFELAEAGLKITVMGQELTFAPKGAVSGIYGQWSAQAPGVGELVWSMGGGKIKATALCDSGLTATATATARFTNHLTIQESAQDEVEEGGITCSVGIAAGSFDYRFDGDTLVLITNGQELRFDPS